MAWGKGKGKKSSSHFRGSLSGPPNGCYRCGSASHWANRCPLNYAAPAAPAARPVAPTHATPTRLPAASEVPIYLNCPFSDKEQAKALGARWDQETRAWYVPATKALLPFVQWISPSARETAAAAPLEAAAPPTEMEAGRGRSMPYFYVYQALTDG